MTQSKVKELTDNQIISAIKAADVLELPMSRRFEGDDKALEDLVLSIGSKPTLVNKLLIRGEVLRECAERGLKVPRAN